MIDPNGVEVDLQRCPECGGADRDACSRCIREALGCCCHAVAEPCPAGDETRHRHLCRGATHFGPRRHCPDDGCPGGCWIWED